MSLPQAPLILLVFANDKQAYLESIRQERSELLALLTPITIQLGMELKDIDYTTVEGVIELINVQRERLVLLHFAGHSNTDLLNLDQGQLHAIGLAANLKRCTNLRLVFLNGCNNTELAKAIAQAGISNVIGTRERIIDKVAKQFSYYFYAGLAEQQLSVSEAYTQAWSNISAQTGESYRSLDIVKSSNEPNWAWYLLSSNSNWTLAQAANPCNRLPALNRGELPNSPYKNLAYYEVKDAEIFFGRCRELLEIINLLDTTKEPIFILHGGTGVGKSSFLQAGLVARLQAKKQYVNYKRLTNLDAKQDLIDYLFASNEVEQITAYLHQPNTEGLPAIYIFDQVEELFFLDEKNASNLTYTRINQLLTTLHQVFYPSNSVKRPEAKILFCLRTEWFGKLYDACKLWDINHSSYLLKPPDKMAIMEIIESPATIDYLKQFYQLTIVDPPYGYLAEQIADDLLVDKESTIAPTLQIILSRLWDKVVNKPERIWNESLYLEEKNKGLLLKDYLTKQLEHIAEKNLWGKEAYQSGLLLDILFNHITEYGTAKTVSQEEYERLYQHIPYRLNLLKELKDCHLLIEANTDQYKKQTRIIHDSLAALVKVFYEKSDLVGQRARRILDLRKDLWVDKSNKYNRGLLNKEDLLLVKQGVIGTYYNEPNSLEVSVIKKSINNRWINRLQTTIGLIALLILIVLASIIIPNIPIINMQSKVNRLQQEINDFESSIYRAEKVTVQELDDRIKKLSTVDDNKIGKEYSILKYDTLVKANLLNAVLSRKNHNDDLVKSYALEATIIGKQAEKIIENYDKYSEFIRDINHDPPHNRYSILLFNLLHAYALLDCIGEKDAAAQARAYQKKLSQYDPAFIEKTKSPNDLCLENIIK